MKKNKYSHNIAMGIILVGSLILFSIAFWWYNEGNLLMSLGMSTMAIIALSNFYLHFIKMKRK